MSVVTTPQSAFKTDIIANHGWAPTTAWLACGSGYHCSRLLRWSSTEHLNAAIHDELIHQWRLSLRFAKQPLVTEPFMAVMCRVQGHLGIAAATHWG